MGKAARELKSELLAETIRNHGEVRLRVTGASMLPVIWPGDVLTIQREDIHQLTPGSIALCRNGKQLQVHRVQGCCSSYLITRGDALTKNDPPVSAEHILGRVTAITRHRAIVPMHRPSWVRVVSALLCRSDLAVRVFLRLLARKRQYSEQERSCVG